MAMTQVGPCRPRSELGRQPRRSTRSAGFEEQVFGTGDGDGALHPPFKACAIVASEDRGAGFVGHRDGSGVQHMENCRGQGVALALTRSIARPRSYRTPRQTASSSEAEVP